MIRSRKPGSEWIIVFRGPSDRQYQPGNTAYIPSTEEKELIEDAYKYFSLMDTPQRNHILIEQFDALTLWDFRCEYSIPEAEEERDYQVLLEALNKMNLTYARLEELLAGILS